MIQKIAWKSSLRFLCGFALREQHTRPQDREQCNVARGWAPPAALSVISGVT
jgi:hypothetical protein